MELSIERTYSEYAEKLHSIEEELRAQPITEELREQIIHELDEVHGHLSKCESTAVSVNRFAQSFLQELREKAVFLYGEIDEFYHQHEIDVIKQETNSLAQTVQQRDFLKLAMVIDSLRNHLTQLLASYSPDLSERRILVFAKMTLDQAEALRKGKAMPEFDLSEETLQVTEAIIEEIAEYLGNNDKGALKLLMNQLTPAQRRLIMGYLDPQDLLTELLHDVERAASDDQLFQG
jgi:hypothetical protein